MSTQRNEFIRFLKLLDDNGCLRHVILVGSWAEFLYEECGLIEGFEANIKTLDIDFLLKNQRLPNPPKNLAEIARGAGYLVESDRLTGTTKIYDKAGLEIEFLLGKVGAGLEFALETNLGITAQTLRHMDVLKRNTQALDFLGMKVFVPLPEAYAIHKMIINKERGKKQEKDARAIEHLLPYLHDDVFASIEKTLTKRERNAVESFLTETGTTRIPG